jgi:Protein of unknown function (DUF3987)
MQNSPRKLKSSWIGTLTTAIDHISEAPRNYNMWAAISVVSSVLKNKVYIKYGTYTIYPNQYIVMVGPPGIGKGQSITFPYDIAKTAGLINIIPDRITAPKIIERMAQGTPGAAISTNGSISLTTDGSALLYSSELPTLLSSSDWMMTFLCDAWDKKDYSYDTKNSGSAVVKNMCTSLIGACVPDYIRRLSKDATSAITSGFTARTIFAYAEEKSKSIPWPKSLEDTQQGRLLLQNLSDDLKHISTLQGSFSFTQAAIIMFEDFHKKFLKREDSDSDVVMNFKARMHVHVFKTAMAISCAERDDLVINDIDLHCAIVAVKSVLLNIDKAFRGVGESDLAEATNRVESFLEKRGMIGATRGDILGALHRHISPETLERILPLLVQIGFAKVFDIGGKIYFRAARKNPVVTANLNGKGTI